MLHHKIGHNTLSCSNKSYEGTWQMASVRVTGAVRYSLSGVNLFHIYHLLFALQDHIKLDWRINGFTSVFAERLRDKHSSQLQDFPDGFFFFFGQFVIYLQHKWLWYLLEYSNKFTKLLNSMFSCLLSADYSISRYCRLI